MRARLTYGLVLAAAVFSPLGAQTVIRYEAFGSTAGLQLNGATVSEDRILLASKQTYRRGSFFTSAQYNVSEFSAVFQFRISSPGGANDGIEAGADGLTFTLQRVGASALGDSGIGLGYQGISSSIAVEFDTFANSHDPDSNHIGINSNGNITSLTTVGIASAFDPNSSNSSQFTDWTVWVDYNGSQLEVRASNNAIRPSSPTLAYSISIPSTIGGTSAFIGFTAATGAAFGDHEILNFGFSEAYLADGLAVPEPSTYALMGLGLVAVGWSVWRRRR